MYKLRSRSQKIIHKKNKIISRRCGISKNSKIKFIDSCKNGDIKKAKLILKNNPNIDITAETELAFHCARENGHLKITKWLLKTNPLINMYDKKF